MIHLSLFVRSGSGDRSSLSFGLPPQQQNENQKIKAKEKGIVLSDRELKELVGKPVTKEEMDKQFNQMLAVAEETMQMLAVASSNDTKAMNPRGPGHS